VSTPTTHIETLLTAGLGLTFWVTAGCGSAQLLATEKLATAQRAVQDATQSEAAFRAVPELDTARTKLAEATAAAEAGGWQRAALLADEAQADAEYARARAAAHKATETLRDMRQNVQLLRQELERSGR
jgi:hypothetical protein